MARITIETNQFDIAGIAVDLEFAGRLFESGGFTEAKAKLDAIRAALDCFDVLIVQRQQERQSRASRSGITRMVFETEGDNQ